MRISSSTELMVIKCRSKWVEQINTASIQMPLISNSSETVRMVGLCCGTTISFSLSQFESRSFFVFFMLTNPSLTSRFSQ